jgi:hypothetical protein
MPAKKRPTYSKTKVVKALARERVGTPPPARPFNEKAAPQKPKHKKNWLSQPGQDEE